MISATVSSILESAILNSSKPIRFAHLQKLANQLTLNGGHVIEITKVCTVTFMKARNCLVFRCKKNVPIRKKEITNRVLLTSKLIRCVKKQQNCLWTTSY